MNGTINTKELQKLCEAVVRDLQCYNYSDISMAQDWAWANFESASLPALEKFFGVDEANRRIEELESAMMNCIESVRSIRWGHDGDGGASNAVEIMDDTLSEIRTKATNTAKAVTM